MVLYAEHVKEPDGILSTSSCILALSPVTKKTKSLKLFLHSKGIQSYLIVEIRFKTGQKIDKDFFGKKKIIKESHAKILACGIDFFRHYLTVKYLCRMLD